MPELAELWKLVESIPPGKVCSYGGVGRAISTPTTGRMVGRWMASCPPNVPWWRVVAADGKLPIWKLDPNLERRQVDHLAQEGIATDGGRVEMRLYAVELDPL